MRYGRRLLDVRLILLASLLTGCMQLADPDVPDPEPGPGPVDPDGTATATIASTVDAIDSALRKTYIETANRLESGSIKTFEAMVADESARFDDAFDKAVQGLADREKRETVPGWTPQKAAEFRRKAAGER